MLFILSCLLKKIYSAIKFWTKRQLCSTYKSKLLRLVVDGRLQVFSTYNRPPNFNKIKAKFGSHLIKINTQE